ncbi:MAG: phosphatase PAP2 family protein [Lachnospiraceae bacterium]|nr:phosphatase PAP2 family protein [Lachnospiraceae bacterium]
MSDLQAIDENILLWVQENIRTEKLTPFIRTLTKLGDYGLLWIGFSMVLMLNKDTRKAGKLSLVSICVCFLINNMILKNLVDRDRPYEVLNELKILIERQPDSSFPSGHAANSLASAIVFFKMFKGKKSRVSILLAGLVMALSRVYVGVHYLSDVLVGISVGIISGLSVCKFAKKKE